MYVNLIYKLCRLSSGSLYLSVWLL